MFRFKCTSCGLNWYSSYEGNGTEDKCSKCNGILKRMENLEPSEDEKEDNNLTKRGVMLNGKH